MAKVPEFVPIFDDIIDKSEQRIDEFLAIVNKTYNPLPPLLANAVAQGTSNLPTVQNDVRLIAYSYLRSNSWNVKAAVKMLDRSVAFRKRIGADTMPLFPSAMPVSGFDQNDVIARLGLQPRQPNDPQSNLLQTFNAFMKIGFHSYDKRGLPVCYWMMDEVDVKGALKRAKQSIPVGTTITDYADRYCSYIAETGWALCRYHDKCLAERPNPALNTGGPRRNFVTVVIDARRLSTKMFHKPAIDLMKDCMTHMNQYYADCIHRVLVVNCPSLIRFAYSVVKPAINEGLQRKITFVNPEDTELALHRVIGKERVPSFLGGTCNCPGGCISTYSPNSVLSAEEDGGSDVITEDIKLTAGEKHEKAFELAQGEDVTWEFVSTKGVDVRFTVNFFPKQQGMTVDAKKKKVRIDKKMKKTTAENPLVKSQKLTDGADHFIAPEDGILQLVWDNSNSWVQDKPVQMRVFKSAPLEDNSE